MAGGCYCYDTMMSGNDSRACGSPCEGKCRYEATGLGPPQLKWRKLNKVHKHILTNGLDE